MGLTGIAFIDEDIWMPLFALEKLEEVSRCIAIDATSIPPIPACAFCLSVDTCEHPFDTV